MNQIQKINTHFIDPDKLSALAHTQAPSGSKIQEILNKALRLKGLNSEETACLLQVTEPGHLTLLLETAGKIKQMIYGNRLVLFAPLYIGNQCSNNCLYCGFRIDNKELVRKVLTLEEVRLETTALLQEGHKRLLLLCGESGENTLDYFLEAIRTIYATEANGSRIRRINAEIAPLEAADFARLKQANIGTYACFQETYDPTAYARCHPSGPKADYAYRLTVMDRAMRAGIDDVGLGVLFGLSDYKYEVLALMAHAAHLEKEFNCGPHTISVPRIEPAAGAPLSQVIPCPVSDIDFKKIVAVLRISLPYTGIILSTRESETLRDELFAYGISQISAGSRTNPGAYAEDGKAEKSGSQFALGDHRSLDEVIATLIAKEYIPSFCTGCYRKGRVGRDFMDLAKPGLIQKFCMPNGVFTFAEYLSDYAADTTRKNGEALIRKLIAAEKNSELRALMDNTILKIKEGERDLYL